MESKEKIIIVALIVIIVAVLVGIVATMSVGEKQDTNLTFKSNSTLTEGDSLKFKLTDSNGTAIANKTVNVTISDKNDAKYYYSVKTNKNGTGTIKLDKDPGKYNVTVKFGGTKEYNACHATKQITVKEEVVESQPAQQSSSSSSSDNGNYYNGYSRSDFSEGEQAAIDDARAHGYSSPAAYYQATGKTAGQAYLDAHPELADRR